MDPLEQQDPPPPYDAVNPPSSTRNLALVLISIAIVFCCIAYPFAVVLDILLLSYDGGAFVVTFGVPVLALELLLLAFGHVGIKGEKPAFIMMCIIGLCINILFCTCCVGFLILMIMSPFFNSGHAYNAQNYRDTLYVQLGTTITAAVIVCVGTYQAVLAHFCKMIREEIIEERANNEPGLPNLTSINSTVTLPTTPMSENTENVEKQDMQSTDSSSDYLEL